MEHKVTRVNQPQATLMAWTNRREGGRETSPSLHSPHHATAGMWWWLQEPSSPSLQETAVAEQYIHTKSLHSAGLLLNLPPLAAWDLNGNAGERFYSSWDTSLLHAASTCWLPPLVTQLSYFTLKSERVFLEKRWEMEDKTSKPQYEKKKNLKEYSTRVFWTVAWIIFWIHKQKHGEALAYFR